MPVAQIPISILLRIFSQKFSFACVNFLLQYVHTLLTRGYFAKGEGIH